jgi:hypothetical protein
MSTESDGLVTTTDTPIRLPAEWTQAEWQAELAKTKPANIIAFLRANKVQPSAFRLLPELIKLPTNQLLIAQTLAKTPKLAAKWTTSDEPTDPITASSNPQTTLTEAPRSGLTRMQRQKPVTTPILKPHRDEAEEYLEPQAHPEPNGSAVPIDATLELRQKLSETEDRMRELEQQLDAARSVSSRLEAELATLQRTSKFATEFVERIQDVVETERGTDFRKYPAEKRPARLKTETLKVLRSEAAQQAEIDSLRKQLKSPTTTAVVSAVTEKAIEHAIAPQVKAAMQAIMLHGKAEWNAIQRLVNLLLQDVSLTQVDIASLRHVQAEALLRGKRDDEALSLLGEALRLFISKKRYADALDCLVLALRAISTDGVSPDVLAAMRSLVSQVPDDSMRKLVHPLARLRSRNRKAFEHLLPITTDCVATKRLIAGVDALATRRITDVETLSLPLVSGRRHSCTVREIIRRIERGDESYIERVREGLELLLQQDDALALAIEACLRDSASPWALIPLHNHHWRAAVIDASNIARWNSGKAGDKSVSHASRIKAIWQQLVLDGYFPVNIYADANLKHNVTDPDVLTQLIDHGSLHITHGEEADRVILRWASKHAAIVVTNDRNMLSAHADVIPSEDAPERAGFEFTKSGMPKIHGTCAFRRESQQPSQDEA